MRLVNTTRLRVLKPVLGQVGPIYLRFRNNRDTDPSLDHNPYPCSLALAKRNSWSPLELHVLDNDIGQSQRHTRMHVMSCTSVLCKEIGSLTEGSSYSSVFKALPPPHSAAPCCERQMRVKPSSDEADNCWSAANVSFNLTMSLPQSTAMTSGLDAEEAGGIASREA